jgi:uncharacterized protein (TIGR02145 family)
MKKIIFILTKLLPILLFSICTISCKKEKEAVPKKEHKNQPIVEDFVTDIRDNNVYKSIAIGDQIWMAENLKYLPEVHDVATFYKRSHSLEPAFSVYGYDGNDIDTATSKDNYQVYGVLYNWFAVNSSNICPKGWHVATKDDWDVLIDYLGGYEIAGGKLKESGLTHWKNPNSNATNEVGFSALPGGYILSNFSSLGSTGGWWTSSEPANIPGFATSKNLIWRDSIISTGASNKLTGYSVRCILD